MQRENLEWRELINISPRYRYWVSNYGDIKRGVGDFIDKAGRHIHCDEKIFWSEEQSLAGGNEAQGEYKMVNINGKKMYSHRLAASVFIPNPERKPEINHKDGITYNNYCGCKEKNYEDSNLEWVTRKENMEHASKNGLINHESLLRKITCKKNQKKSLDVTKKPVYQMDLNGNILNEFESTVEAGKATGIQPQRISAVATGAKYRKSCNGYVWVYVEDYDPKKDYSYNMSKEKSKKAVTQYDMEGNFIAEYESIVEAYRSNGWHPNSYIGECCSGRRRKYKNYKWKYKK